MIASVAGSDIWAESGGWHRADGRIGMTTIETTSDPALGKRPIPLCLGHPEGRRGRLCSRMGA